MQLSSDAAWGPFTSSFPGYCISKHSNTFMHILENKITFKLKIWKCEKQDEWQSFLDIWMLNHIDMLFFYIE